MFFRTLLKSSAIFIGAATIFLHPSLEWRSDASDRRRSRADRASAPRRRGSEAAIDGLIVALKDTDAGVRRQAVRALAAVEQPPRRAGARRRR